MRVFTGLSWLAALTSLACHHLDHPTDAGDAVKYAHLKAAILEAEKLSSVRAELEAAVKIYNQDGDMWRRVGVARFGTKDYDGCIDAMSQALKLGFANKFNAIVMYRVATAYALKGDLKQGMLWLQKSMTAGYRDLEQVRNDPNLNALHGDPAWEELAATKDMSGVSRDAGFRYDLWLLDREVRRLHYNPYSHYTKAEQDAWVKQLNGDIPNMTDDQIQTSFMKYMRRMGDGHTFIFQNPASARLLPLATSWLPEGLTIVSADASLKDLVGAQITKIAGHSTEDVFAQLGEVALHDNNQSLMFYGLFYLLNPTVLHGLGLSPDSDDVDLTVKDLSGSVRSVKVRAVAPNPNQVGYVSLSDLSNAPLPLYLRNKSKPYWFEPIPELGAVYFRYNQVQDDPQEDTEKFAARMFDYIDQHHVEKLIVDIRLNGGGNAYLTRPIENGIIACKKIQGRGHLFVIIGRGTFSAAQVFATDIGRSCNPIYVGEATGSKPNFVGESNPLTLPYSHMQASIADIYFQRSWPTDDRTWIAPDLPAPPSLQLLKANRDPALEAIAAYVRA